MVNLNVVGIDIGDMLYVVVVFEEFCKGVNVRDFGIFIDDFFFIVEWFIECGVIMVVMESIGIYWKNFGLLLIEKGFEVYLVNVCYICNISGKKND